MNALVIYHADCYDGFSAAWIAHTAMGGAVDLFPAKYGEPPPWDLADGRDVYVLDFSYPRGQMVQLDIEARSLVVLDHHKTAQENCEGLSFCTFDMERSGAGMAWDYFMFDKPRPVWVQCVEDRDLWRFKHPATKAIHAYLTSCPMTLEAWSEIHQAEWYGLAHNGNSILRTIDRYCEKMFEHTRFGTLWDVPASIVNAPYLNCSELCNYMLSCTDQPNAIAVAYFQRGDRQWQFSLRGKPDGTDVSEIAKQYGGGGHFSAAGFSVAELSDVFLKGGDAA